MAFRKMNIECFMLWNEETLKEKDERVVSLCLSDIKKYGWLEARLDPQDSRIRLYKLKGPEEAVKEMR